MTHRLDVARGHDTVARWCALAEQRLEYLTELFETGRWRRYHSEVAFLENIQEAKTAVETWRDLATREAALHNQVHPFSPQPAEIPVYTLPRDVSMAGPDDHISSEEAPSAPAMNDASELARSLDAIEQRYPLLRNAL
jgi:uncharacterized repeat protein (TIGR03809 family)